MFLIFGLRKKSALETSARSNFARIEGGAEIGREAAGAAIGGQRGVRDEAVARY
jgi:hypothetical protein